MNKTLVIFTNYLDAIQTVESGYLTMQHNGNLLAARTVGASIIPISVVSPSLKSELGAKIVTVDRKYTGARPCIHLCPTYRLEDRRLTSHEWEPYKQEYKASVMRHRDSIRQWLSSLYTGQIYFLCCWETLSGNNHCHREILHDMFSKSASLSDKFVFINRDGTGSLLKTAPHGTYNPLAKFQGSCDEHTCSSPFSHVKAYWPDKGGSGHLTPSGGPRMSRSYAIQVAESAFGGAVSYGFSVPVDPVDDMLSLDSLFNRE